MGQFLILAIVLSFAEGGALYYIKTMFRSLQIMLNLPLMRISIPGNLSMVHEKIIPVVMFDILPEAVTNAMFKFDETEHEK